MNTDRTVFVVQEPFPDRVTGEPVRDFTPALRFGRLKVLLAYDVNPDDGDELARRLLDAGLRDYEAGDSLILSGHPATIGVAVSLVTGFLNLPVRMLIWSGRTRSYTPITFNVNELEMENQDG